MMIVIEGADAVGKKTQSTRLAERLTRQATIPAKLFSFPRYQTPLGFLIGRHLKGEIVTATSIITRQPALTPPVVQAPGDAMIFQSMMITDKYDAAPEIEEHLKVGGSVVCDRYWQSAFAYGTADGLPRDWLFRAHQHLPQADLNVFIDLSPEEAQRRRPELLDRYEKDRTKQARVRENYQMLWKAQEEEWRSTYRGGRWIVVDGAGSEDEVHEWIWRQVVRTREALGLGHREQLDGGAP
jgi:thymidylate kinase